jgi:hypothetical protein
MRLQFLSSPAGNAADALVFPVVGRSELKEVA